tara:strand:+ start:44 stop:250 length:207 start_codon:yes stop_codon:yes gene_type:complete
MIDILIENSKDRKWVERELEEFADENGFVKLKEPLQYWLNFFKSSKYSPKKFRQFMNNFINTYNTEIK